MKCLCGCGRNTKSEGQKYFNGTCHKKAHRQRILDGLHGKGPFIKPNSWTVCEKLGECVPVYAAFSSKCGTCMVKRLNKSTCAATRIRLRYKKKLISEEENHDRLSKCMKKIDGRNRLCDEYLNCLDLASWGKRVFDKAGPCYRYKEQPIIQKLPVECVTL